MSALTLNSNGTLVKLSARELECAALYCNNGFSPTIVGRKLSLSPRTVSNYIARARIKLQVKDRTNLFLLLFDRGHVKNPYGLMNRFKYVVCGECNGQGIVRKDCKG